MVGTYYLTLWGTLMAMTSDCGVASLRAERIMEFVCRVEKVDSLISYEYLESKIVK